MGLLDITSFWSGIIINLLLITLVCFMFQQKYTSLQVAIREQNEVIHDLLSQSNPSEPVVIKKRPPADECSDNEEQSMSNLSTEHTNEHFMNAHSAELVSDNNEDLKSITESVMAVKSISDYGSDVGAELVVDSDSDDDDDDETSDVEETAVETPEVEETAVETPEETSEETSDVEESVVETAEELVNELVDELIIETSEETSEVEESVVETVIETVVETAEDIIDEPLIDFDERSVKIEDEIIFENEVIEESVVSTTDDVVVSTTVSTTDDVSTTNDVSTTDDVSATDDVIDFNSMSVKELKQYLSNKGVKNVNKNAKKGELLRMVNK